METQRCSPAGGKDAILDMVWITMLDRLPHSSLHHGQIFWMDGGKKFVEHERLVNRTSKDALAPRRRREFPFWQIERPCTQGPRL